MVNPPHREFAYTDDDFRFVVRMAKELAGISLSEHKRDMVYSRMARRVRKLGLDSIREYCELVESDPKGEESGHFVNSITTNLTSFFRESHHFEHMAQVLTELVKHRGQKRVRIWSAGCSAGMEAYTMAMTIYNTLGDLKGMDIKILATDIDTNILAFAQAGVYPEKEIEKVPSHLRDKYFKRIAGKAGAEYEVSSHLKTLVSFKQLNLMEDWPMSGPFDIVFCRNVVIYFDKPTQQRLFMRYADIIAKGGYLYIGHSETLRGVSDRFQYAEKTIYRKVA
jgi:chemotaxis protein methyltransferase CheR